ncbi:MAG: hypothetical protein J3Q66DRAFT_364739 [Benniella sp.]|nr:MAG: hypothetical protein J3Q66DRAFT_364739 [Benniella sp.]
MPALTDKIFLPISVFVLNIVLAVFKVVLISAVSACFAIYAKYGGEYAKSVGWVRGSGYIEMVKTLKNTSRRKNVPVSVKWALVAALFLTLIASLLDKGIAFFITPTSRPGPSTPVVVRTKQYAPEDVNSLFVGWDVTVPTDGSAVNAMRKALTGPIANPNATVGLTYTPILNAFNATCSDLSVDFEDFPTKSHGCAKVNLSFSADTKVLKASERSPNRWSITMESNLVPEDPNFLDNPLSVFLSSEVDCGLVELYRRKGSTDYTTMDGVSALPKTLIAKCFNDNAIAVIAMTTTRLFGVGQFYNLHEKFADGSDELLVHMDEALKGQDFKKNKPAISTVWVELRVANSTIDLYACATSKPSPSVPDNYRCIFSTIHALMFTQQLSKDILEEQGTANFDRPYMSLDVALRARSENGIRLSTDLMKQDTVAVANELAQLEYFLFYPDTFYIQYKATAPKLGFEIPLWVLVVAGIILIACFSMWQLTDWLVGSPYTSSLYSIIRKELESRSNSPTPRLMRFQFEPLMFEDVWLLPEHVESSPDESELLQGDVKVDVDPEAK